MCMSFLLDLQLKLQVYYPLLMSYMACGKKTYQYPLLIFENEQY